MLTHRATGAPPPTPTPPVSAPRAATPAPARLGLELKLLLFCAVTLLARITLFIRQRSGDRYDEIDVSAAVQIGLVAISLMLFVAAAPALFRLWTRLAGTSGRLWLVFLAVGMLSAAWSIHPSYSLFRALEAFSQSLILFVVIAALGPPRRAERWVLGLVWLALVFDVAGNYRLTAGFSGGAQSNSFSAMAAMIAAYSLGEAVAAVGTRRRGLMISGLLAALVLIVGSSLASWWALLVGLMVAGTLMKRSGLLLLVAMLVLLLLTLGGSDIVHTLLLRNKPVEQLETLHGRTILWSHFWEVYKERPLLGYGFAIGARTQGVVYTTNTHNALLSVLLGCGALGLLVAVGMGARYGRELWRACRARVLGAAGALAAATTAFVNSLSLAFLGESWMPATFVFVTLFALFVLHIAPAARNLDRDLDDH